MVSNCSKIYPWYHLTCLSTLFKNILNLLLSLLSLVLRKTRVFLTFKWFAVWRQWQNYHWCSTRISTSNRKLFQTTWFKSISTMGSINGNHNWFNWHDWRGMVESGTFWILFYLHVDLRTILTLNCCSLFQTAFHSKLEMSQLIFTENQSTGFYELLNWL